MPKIVFRFAITFGVLCVFIGGYTCAQDSRLKGVAQLTPDEQQAINSVTLKNVRATVSFLASDELAGRDTPSRELDIATAYVAARFRGAGLAGGGDEGSFYQEHQLPLTTPPREGISLAVGTRTIKHRGVLAAVPEAVDLTGKITVLGTENAKDDLTGVVIVDEVKLNPQFAGNIRYILSMYSRRIVPLAKKGAKVVLVKTADDSQLPGVVRSLLEKPTQPPRRFPIPCPIVLIDAAALPDGKVHVVVPAAEHSGATVRNVIGVLKGSDPKLVSEAVIVSAHLDHIGRASAGPDRINNGADDNASGVTGVLLMADAFAQLKQRPRRSVVFMTFWGEEKGLLGSKHFVQHPLWPLDKVVANINLEMIGRPEAGATNKAWMTGWEHSNLGSLMAVGAKRADVEIFNHKKFGKMLYKSSDNFPFVQSGVIAHSISAGSLHSDYHRPGDEWEKLNLPHMTRIIRGLVAATLPIANGDLTPEAAARK